MARTKKDTADYFPHDADASDGNTLTVLQGRYGNNGYAFWFKLLEKLTSADGHYLDLQNPVKWQVFISKMGVDEKTTLEIMDLLVVMQNIDTELWHSRVVWCQNLVDNLADVYKNRKRDLPSKPILTEKNGITTLEMPISTPGQTPPNPLSPHTPLTPLPPKSKVKESKVKETTVVVGNLSKEDVLEAYRQNIGELSGGMDKQVELAVDLFSASWVIDAIREALLHNKPTWVYIAGILKNWKKDGKDAGTTPEGSGDPDKFIKGKYGHLMHR